MYLLPHIDHKEAHMTFPLLRLQYFLNRPEASLDWNQQLWRQQPTARVNVALTGYFLMRRRLAARGAALAGHP